MRSVYQTCLSVSSLLASTVYKFLDDIFSWGVAPIVREAQSETRLQFPEKLDYAVNERKEMEYSCGWHVRSSQKNENLLTPALPMYQMMATAAENVDSGELRIPSSRK